MVKKEICSIILIFFPGSKSVYAPRFCFHIFLTSGQAPSTAVHDKDIMGEQGIAIIMYNEKVQSAVMSALNTAHGLQLLHPT